MLKNLIILPDGTEIYSGNARDNAIISCAYTQCVNDGTELSIGSACCNELEVKLFSVDGLSIAAGDEIQYYKVDDNGERTKISVFRCEKPTITGTGTYKFMAYDNVSKLDKDLTEWLDALDGWPYTVAAFAEKVCSACGLSLAAPPAVNASYKIRKFSGSGVTGRMLMQWLGQVACRFIRANADGEIEFAWYTDKGAEITTSGEFAYFGGGLSYEDYQVAEIQKVQIQATDEDNGTVYPDGSEEELNTYKITGNYLLTAETGDELKPVAQAIYEQLRGVTYTPCKVSIQATTEINAGDIAHITDRNGVRMTTYVMSKINKGQKDTLECTGSYKRDSSTATNTLTMKALNGKVLDIKKSVDGLRIENKDTADKVATIELTVDGLKTSVKDAEGNMSELKQIAGEVHVSAKKYSTVSTEYTFSHNEAGELLITYTGDKPNYSIDEDGNLILTYTGEKPDIWADESGYILTTEENLGTSVAIGELKTKIDGKGTWNSEFIQNGERVSALYFDFEKSRFTFDGHVVARSGEIGGCLIVGGKLQVPAANIDGALTFGDGSYYIDPSATTSYLKLPGLEITNSGASFTGSVTSDSVTVNGGLIRVPTSFKWLDTIDDGTQIDGEYIYLRSGGKGFAFTPTTWGYSHKNASKILAEYKGDVLKFSGASFPGWSFGTVSITNASGNEVYSGQAMYSDEIETNTAKSKAFLTPEGVYSRTEANGTVYVKHATWPQIAGIGGDL